MKCYRGFLVLLVLLSAPSVLAQNQGRGGMGAYPAAVFAKLFGHHTSFSATADMTMSGRGGSHSMEMKYAVLDGQLRMDMDMDKMEGVPPESVARMKEMGMDKTVTLVHTGKDATTYLIYPNLQSYVDIHPPASDDNGSEFSIAKTRIGTETIDGHPTVKYKLTITRPNGKSGDLISWEATDMNNFPIRSQMTGENGTMTIDFKDINQSKPAASLFVVPSDYKHYDNMRSMMMSQMGRMMGHMGGR